MSRPQVVYTLAEQQKQMDMLRRDMIVSITNFRKQQLVVARYAGEAKGPDARVESATFWMKKMVEAKIDAENANEALAASPLDEAATLRVHDTVIFYEMLKAVALTERPATLPSQKQ